MNSKQSFDELLEKELQKPLEIEFSARFEEEVFKKITAKNEVLLIQNNWVVNAAVGGFVLLSVICLLIFVPEELKTQMIQILLFAIPVGLLIGIFQYLDHRYVRNQVRVS